MSGRSGRLDARRRDIEDDQTRWDQAMMTIFVNRLGLTQQIRLVTH